MTDPTLTVGLPNFGGYLGYDWRLLLDIARLAEDAGVDRLVVVDHVVMGNNTAAYSWGRFPVPPEEPWLEPLTVISALAAVTSLVRFSTGILIAPLRPAALLAKTAATVDALSGGRLDLGVGVGWQREEYEALGLRFEDRGRLLDETIATCRALWSSLPATVNGLELYSAPQPATRLPVWFGGTLNARNLRRITELGDGWIPIMGATVDDIRAGAATLRAAVSDRPIDVQAPALMARNEDKSVDIAGTIASVPTLVDAGATDIYVNLTAICGGDLSDPAPVLTELIKQFGAAT